MTAIQTLLFPDPRPLVDTLGQEFFRNIPQSAGVYLMRDASLTVLYVGKAKNLRKRLCSYRVANPDRLPRRHLRMLRAVVRIDLEELPDEGTALARESELLLKLRPRFNRAGTWPAPPRFVMWRQTVEHLELRISQNPQTGWEGIGPLGSISRSLRNALARLIWCALHPQLGPSRMPVGWLHGQFEEIVRIRTPHAALAPTICLHELCCGKSEGFLQWVRTNVPLNAPLFDQAVIDIDLELISNLFDSAVGRRLALSF